MGEYGKSKADGKAKETAMGMTRKQRVAGIVVVELAILAILAWHGCNRPTDDPPPLAFDGPSDKLAATTILPTLDTPILPGKNAIWCASFQLAWDRLKQDAVKQPVDVTGAEEVAERLNAGQIDPAQLPPGSFYAVAGKADTALVKTIRDEMARRFPNRRTETRVEEGEGFLAFAYLQAAAKFTHPYFDRKTPIDFKDSAGKVTTVSGFGLFETDGHAEVNETLARQVGLLYSPPDDRTMQPDEFILDLDRDSNPVQVIVARMPAPKSLADAVEWVDQHTRQQADKQQYFGSAWTLAVPNLNWKIDHHFAELEGPDRHLRNAGFTDLWITSTRQIIEFRLDKSGAGVTGESMVNVGADGLNYILDGPFLIMMQDRAAKRPFFVMWVDNPELLSKR